MVARSLKKERAFPFHPDIYNNTHLRYTWNMSENASNLQSAIDQIVFQIRRLLKRKNPVLVALDGRSGTGKSTLAQLIAGRVEAVIVVGDDFYSGGNDDAWSGFQC